MQSTQLEKNQKHKKGGPTRPVGHPRGVLHTETTRQKMSEAHKRRTPEEHEAYIQKLRDANQNRFIGPAGETLRQHLRDIALNRSPELKEKIRQGLRQYNKEHPPKQHTHCIHGHEFTPENIAWRIRDGRKQKRCRICLNLKARRRNARKRQERGIVPKAPKKACKYPRPIPPIELPEPDAQQRTDCGCDECLNTSGIYRITCTKDDKYYLGSSINIRKRWNAHRCDLKKNDHDNDHMQNVWNKHNGQETFRFEILRLVPPEQLVDIENEYLKIHIGTPNCMNIVETAQTPPSYNSMTEEARKKFRDSVSEHHWNKQKTHCKNGHEFTPENTIWGEREKNGRTHVFRECRQCRTDCNNDPVLRQQRREYNQNRRNRIREEQVKAGKVFLLVGRAKTHCVHGHEFTLENTIWSKQGRRKCKECKRSQQKQRNLDRYYGDIETTRAKERARYYQRLGRPVPSTVRHYIRSK